MPCIRRPASLCLFAALLGLLTAGCRPGDGRTAGGAPPSSPAPADKFAGNKRMRAILEALDKNADPGKDIFLSRRRAEALEEQFKRTANPREQAALLRPLAIERMNAGEMEESLNIAEYMARLLRENDPKNESGLRTIPYTLAAIAAMRQGEVQNCCAARSPDACLIPLKGGGIHAKRQYSQTAIKLLTGVLNQSPDDLSARWLLNIASMTLGQYPNGVPEKWRIPPSAFASEYPLKPFPNIAPALGLDVNQLAGGTIAEDFDGDGDLDLIISSFSLKDGTRYFRNNGDGTFTDLSKESGLADELGGQNLVQADYDNDGKPDILILRGGWRARGGHQPKSLLHNNGDGTFSDVTKAAGLSGATLPCMSAVWWDYDGDGKLDLFLANESADGEKNPCQLYRNNGDGTFTESAAKAGLNVVGYVKAAALIDFNNDGKPDLFLSRWKEPNQLFRNDGPASNGRQFTEVGAAAGVTAPLGSFSCFAFDYDNDGWEDLFVVDYDIQSVREVAADYLHLPHGGEKPRLYRNNHNGTFADVTKAMNLDKVLYGMGINFGDLDNDGWLDFYVGTGAPNLSVLIPNRMFRSDAGKRFQEVTAAGNFGHLQKGHGISFADFNNDGTQDIYESMGGAFEGDTARATLYQNPGFGARFLKLKLEGAASNRSGIGARLAVTVADSAGVSRTIHRTVTTGGSFGANPLRLEIGLGDAARIEKVEVRWPATGKTQIFTALELDSAYALREGDSVAQSLPLKKFEYALKAPTATPASASPLAAK